MKTRRIFLQPGEPVEILNAFGTTVLKAQAKFRHEQACVVIFEQPDIPIKMPADVRTEHLTNEPEPSDRFERTIQTAFSFDHSR